MSGARYRPIEIVVDAMRPALCAALLVAAACAGLGGTPSQWSADLQAPRLDGAVIKVDTVARGVLWRSFIVGAGPWAVNVLDIDRRACWTTVAVKGGAQAIGRRKTSELIHSVDRAVGAINADFFLFAPAGMPVGAHVEAGRVLAGPLARPLFAADSSGRPWIGVLSVQGFASLGRDSLAIDGWNRLFRNGVSFFDSHFGAALDTATGAIRVVVDGLREGRVMAIDTTLARTAIPPNGSVLVAGREAPAATRERVLALRPGRSTVRVAVRLAPLHPRSAVGGFPVLVRDSIEVAGLDSAGSASFAPVRHPRTIVATAAGGRRVMFIVVDGRQPGYSVGVTLREAARLTLQLGATDAINLDGGGSSTMVIARPSTPNVYEIVNRPSDPAGERPVGNALAVVKGC